MIDWHSHILPGVDDGSRDVSESLALLNMLSEQGVDTVVATPHFYPDREEVSTFLKRRELAYEALEKHLDSGSPEIVPGAEVYYYPGITRMHELKSLCIEGSKLLLLEMHMNKWSDYTVNELSELASSGRVTVILAHIERFWNFQSAKVWDRLYDCGVLMQVNASFFVNRSSKRKAIALMKNNGIHFVGSDCHNITSRPPYIGKAYEIIEKKFGADYISQMNEFGHSVLVRNIKQTTQYTV